VTDDDLNDVRVWLAHEAGCNAYLNRRGQRSGSELAVEHVRRLLAEVERLRATPDAVVAGRADP
jgi:site-specific recombinase